MLVFGCVPVLAMLSICKSPFCSTVLSHLSVHLFSITGAPRLNTHSVNSEYKFISAKPVGALHLYCNSATPLR